jgi:class 3 adenylate cyclase/DNA-binding CsgD family transcriptional regulator
MARSGTATATVVFTDVVDSTGHRTRLGERAADDAFSTHERLLRDTVDQHGGTVLKGVGDGIMAVFDAASDAVATGVAMIRATHRTTPDFEIRVGVAAGDVTWDGGDCFGLPVVIAKRLESAAEPGGMLVAAIVRQLAGDRAAVDFEPVAPFDLRGISEPVNAYAVGGAISDLGETSPRFRFPVTMPPPPHPFVGRNDELTILRTSWIEAGDGGTTAVLITGEAGAGKSRLAREAAREFHGSGALVLHGSNDQDLSLPYLPWARVVEQIVDQFPRSLIDDALGTESARSSLTQLAHVAPSLERWLAGIRGDDALDPEERAQLVMQGLHTLLSAVTSSVPTIVVLDDLHWAGQQSLAALSYIVRTAPVDRLLLIGTLRATPDEVDAPLAALLADLRRVAWVRRLQLSGLDTDDVESLVKHASATDLLGSDRVAAEIMERTGGNAFFVSEICGQLDVGVDAVPTSVTEVVADRLARLPTGARRAAEVLAVSAGRLALSVAADVLDPGDPTVALDALGALVESGLVYEVPTASELTYQFTHSLVRDAVVESLSTSDSIRLHLMLAETLENLYESDQRAVLPDLVRHFAAAAVIGGRDKALGYGQRAVDQARRSAAYDEGLSVLRTLLAIVPPSSAPSLEMRADLVDLLQRSGEHQAASAAAREAWAASDGCTDVALRAGIALQMERLGNVGGAHASGAYKALKFVLAEIEASPDTPEALRASVAGALGRAMLMYGVTGAEDYILAALDNARSLGDTGALARCLEPAVLLDDPVVVLEATQQLAAVSAQTGDVYQGMWASSNQMRMELRLGALDDLALTLTRHAAVASRYRFYIYRYMGEVFASMLALARGRFAEAEQHAAEVDRLGDIDQDVNDGGVYGQLMFAIRREQGRVEEMRPVIAVLAETDVARTTWGPGLACLYAELGLLDEARSVIDALAPDDFGAIARDVVRPAALGYIAEAAIATGDATHAEALLEGLSAFDGHVLTAGFSVCLGPADRLRAGLLSLVGRHDDADAALSAARKLAAAGRAVVWAARVEQMQSRMCARRGDVADAEAAFAAACAIAEPLGMGSVCEQPPRIDPDRKRVVLAHPDGLTDREIEVLALVAEGCTNRLIAKRLLISPNTAANHVSAILRKTGTSNRAEAAAYAIRQRLAGQRSTD